MAKLGRKTGLERERLAHPPRLLTRVGTVKTSPDNSKELAHVVGLIKRLCEAYESDPVKDADEIIVYVRRHKRGE